SCAPLSNCPGSVGVNQGTINNLDHLNAVPVNGTFINTRSEGGGVGREAGGAPLALTKCRTLSNYPGSVGVNQRTINKLYHLNSGPVYGTFIKTDEPGGVVTWVAGGPPLLRTSCAPLSNCPGSVGVNQGTINNLDHLNAVPVNGTFINT